MSRISENGLLGQKKAPAGWFHSKTEFVNTFPTIPDPIRTKLYLKIRIFIANLLKIGAFQLKSLKKLKLLRKPCYVHKVDKFVARLKVMGVRLRNANAVLQQGCQLGVNALPADFVKLNF